MAEVLNVDLCVIGAGSGGLSVAAGASQMGARTVLIERGRMGGDCLNTGCVPSKSLIAAAAAAHGFRTAGPLGLTAAEPEVDFRRVHAHVRSVIDAIAPNDSVERFEGLGVTVIRESARFVSGDEVVAGVTRIKARRFVVATGSTAAVPPIEGLDGVAYLTNETVFGLTACPRHLVVIGGGPIGCELAQAYRRLGAEVTVVEGQSMLGKDDPELAAVLRRRFEAEGVAIHENTKVVRVAQSEAGIRVETETDGATGSVPGSIEGSHLLLAVGRSPTVEGLDLEKAGVEHSKRGIVVDARLRTTNKRIFAMGDVAGGFQFTHVAGYHAGVVIKNALFWLPAKVHYRALPWVTYTDPELAHVGMTEAQARARHGDALRILRWPFAENDRAQAERETEGFIKAVTDRKGRILGASIVGRHAGELILPWALAIQNKLKIGAFASVIAPYPTLSEVSKRAAGAYYTPSLFSDRTKKIVRFLQKF